MSIVGCQPNAWTRSLTENVGANLIASAITGALAAFTGKVDHLPTVSCLPRNRCLQHHAACIAADDSENSESRWAAKGEAALSLLGGVGLHMLLNRPLNHGVLEQLGRNITWWRDRTIKELTRVGASKYHISRFRDPTVLDVNIAATPRSTGTPAVSPRRVCVGSKKQSQH
jgi:hypothetical protein